MDAGAADPAGASAEALFDPPEAWDREGWFGRVVVVPDKHWGFQAVGRDGHPGVCLPPASLAQRAFHALKGASLGEHPVRAWETVVQPDEGNGLRHATRLELWPRRLPRRALELMVRDRLVGRLSAEDRARLSAELERVLAPEVRDGAVRPGPADGAGGRAPAGLEGDGEGTGGSPGDREPAS